jgi:pyridoxine 4-dehydrogenase
VATRNGVTAEAAGEITIGGDLTVRRMGFGAMRLTGEGIWGEPPDPGAARALLRRVVELGVNFIDTADAYGPEVSERLIREALHPYPKGLVIATKGGLVRRGPGQWEPDGRPEHLKEACENSLRRLRLDTIDLYQLHSPDRKVPFEESVGALADLRAEGKIRHVGLSNVNTTLFARGREIVPIVSAQSRYNLTARVAEDVLQECESDGLAFIPWFPIDAGALAAANERLQEIASRHGATTAQLALAWLLHRSPVTVPIPGTSSIEHLEENVAAAAIELSNDDMAILDELGAAES